jgi:phospholipid/cholesterol/gamma-HCH transport system substrate-binding protein
MTDYQSKQRRRNMVVGLFMVVAFAAFMWMLLRFRDLPLAAGKLRSFEILVYFPEVPGVQKDTPVQYCGYQVGRVLNVAPPKRYNDEEEGEIKHRVGVTIAIDKKFADIPAHSDIRLMTRGLGSSYIEIRVSEVKAAGETAFLKEDMVKYGAVAMASEFFPPDVQKKLENLVDSISELAVNTNLIVGDLENQANIKQLLANLEAAAATANLTLQSFGKFSEVGTEKAELLGDRLITMTESFEGTLSELRQVLAKVNTGDGTAGKLVNDGRLYENLLESSQELEMALEQLKEWAAQAREKGIRIKW